MRKGSDILNAQSKYAETIVVLQTAYGGEIQANPAYRVLPRVIEKAPTRFFVCQNCGSTLVELPKDICPICKSPISQYKEVERIK